jgi:hypothetical protein
MFASIENASTLLIAVVFFAAACLLVFAWRRARSLNEKAGETVVDKSAGEPRAAGPVDAAVSQGLLYLQIGARQGTQQHRIHP